MPEEGGCKECDVCVEKVGRMVKQEAMATNPFLDRGYSQVSHGLMVKRQMIIFHNLTHLLSQIMPFSLDSRLI